MTPSPSGAPRIKFCGLTNLDDAEAALEAGAWALGMILWPGSARTCAREDAARICAAHRRQAELCGVFVNETLEVVTRSVDELGLTMVQLHGDEGPSYAAEVARRTGCAIIKAARVRARADLQDVARFRVDYHLLDAHRDGHWGGTGETFDWSLSADRIGEVPLIVSGGLNAGNVEAAIEVTRPFGVDVSSGVERAPGLKDHAKLIAFAEAVARTAPEPEPDPELELDPGTAGGTEDDPEGVRA